MACTIVHVAAGATPFSACETECRVIGDKGRTGASASPSPHSQGTAPDPGADGRLPGDPSSWRQPCVFSAGVRFSSLCREMAGLKWQRPAAPLDAVLQHPAGLPLALLQPWHLFAPIGLAQPARQQPMLPARLQGRTGTFRRQCRRPPGGSSEFRYKAEFHQRRACRHNATACPDVPAISSILEWRPAM